MAVIEHLMHDTIFLKLLHLKYLLVTEIHLYTNYTKKFTTA